MSELSSGESPFDKATPCNEVQPGLHMSELLAMPRRPVLIGHSEEIGANPDELNRVNGPDTTNITTLDDSQLKDWYAQQSDPTSSDPDHGRLPPVFRELTGTLKTIIDYYKSSDPDYLNKNWYVRIVTGPAKYLSKQATNPHIDFYSPQKTSKEFIVSNIDTTGFIVGGLSVNPAAVDVSYPNPGADGPIWNAGTEAIKADPSIVWQPQPGDIMLFDETIPHLAVETENHATRSALLFVFSPPYEPKPNTTPA